MGLDVAHRHPARVHRQDLVVEAREAPLVLLHQLELERPVAIAWRLDRDVALIRGEGLRRRPVASVAVEYGLAGLVT